MPLLCSLRTWATALVAIGPSLGCGAHDGVVAISSPESRDEPVDWQPWDAETFARARVEGRLILVDVVASWCHWCHVMDDETYADPDVRARIARDFVAIRVEADARPDIAERYSAFGWPATAILTPEAEPVTELRGFQPRDGFLALLDDLATRNAAGRLRGRVEPPPASREAETVEASEALARVVAQIDRTHDPKRGGWGRKQKYPIASLVEHALARAHWESDAEARARGLGALEASTALIDPAWGGMYQYSVGGVWDRPHYEKLLAVQAGAIENFALAALETRDATWLLRIDAITGYLHDHLRVDAAFGASQWADAPQLRGDRFHALDAEARATHDPPPIDASAYADGNGLVVAALAKAHLAAAGLARENDYLSEAIAIQEALIDSHRDEQGLFRHAADDPTTRRYLSDQSANLCSLLALYEATGDRRWRSEADALARATIRAFEDVEGGFRSATGDEDAVGPLAAPRFPVEDNARTARGLLKLHHLADHAAGRASTYQTAATRALARVSRPRAVRAEGRFVGQLALALREAAGARRVFVTIVAEAGDPGIATFHRSASVEVDPRVVVDVSPPGEHYPAREGVTAYVCDDTACSRPIRDAGRLHETVRGFLGSGG